ncbi:Cytochrome c-type biogenesis protein DsbD, protein-disulfide reductase [invertebrate metagenome]|uniref:Cytochrome c-type biogenesis protein DsbD, protein-disulfide reductase n=1 Tax=invertebrate metagenome TaxID=1711999 RepID=A0A484H6N2_9ZZZZ
MYYAGRTLWVGLWQIVLILLAWLVAASEVSLSATTVEKELGLESGDWTQSAAQLDSLLLSTGEETAGPSASPWVRHSQGAVRLVSTVTGVGTSHSILLGLQFALQPHWKIYWRAPGETGYPPTVDWGGSQNLAKTRIAWPAPRRFSFQGVETAGYEGEVIFPITAILERPGVPLMGHANIEFLVCSTLCVPQRAVLDLLVRDGPAESSPFIHLVERSAARVPGDGRAAGLHLITATTQPGTKDGLIEVAVEAELPLAAPDLFIEGHNNVRASLPQISQRSRDSRHVVLRVRTRSPVAVGALVTLTVVDGVRALEATVPLGTLVADHDTIFEIGIILSLAFLGGLILNLMPCVLPVLSLKVMTMISHGGAERLAVRWSFVASAAGVLFSFMLLAAATITLKATGAAVGWGIQFQQPLFLSIMIIVLTLFTANLWGLFEISLPSWLTDQGGGVRTYGYTGAFLTGIFATLLATPCSAPFLGTAVGFALARGPVEILLIFMVLGIGMAMPYILVAIFPTLAVRLPQPGPWMIWLKGLMGLALAATVVWLLTVFAVQVGETTAILTGAAMVTVIGILASRLHPPLRPLPVAVVISVGLTIIAQVGQERETLSHQGLWLPFNENVLAHHVANGRVVFVDITADWCITCRINKALVLSHREVVKRLQDVVAMQADWTRPDVGVSAYLTRFGRYGIPFNVVYGPGARQGIALPELLTAEVVLQALETAAGRV